MPLTQEQITELTNKVGKPRYSPRIQIGPLRTYPGQDRRCTICGFMTVFVLQGLPKCYLHCLEEMNEMLVRCGFGGANYTMPPEHPKTNRLCSTTTYMKVDKGWWLGRLECIHGITLDKDCNMCDRKEYDVRT